MEEPMSNYEINYIQELEQALRDKCTTLEEYDNLIKEIREKAKDAK